MIGASFHLITQLMSPNQTPNRQTTAYVEWEEGVDGSKYMTIDTIENEHKREL